MLKTVKIFENNEKRQQQVKCSKPIRNARNSLNVQKTMRHAKNSQHAQRTMRNAKNTWADERQWEILKTVEMIQDKEKCEKQLKYKKTGRHAQSSSNLKEKQRAMLKTVELFKINETC